MSRRVDLRCPRVHFGRAGGVKLPCVHPFLTCDTEVPTPTPSPNKPITRIATPADAFVNLLDMHGTWHDVKELDLHPGGPGRRVRTPNWRRSIPSAEPLWEHRRTWGSLRVASLASNSVFRSRSPEANCFGPERIPWRAGCGADAETRNYSHRVVPADLPLRYKLRLWSEGTSS